ncbi:hypothetical protein [Plasticicumulans acidivorans]|uniref:Uncharacterized protein n=1 Tax=Plasticicumulans acidivorans TaxID=886464 RepID=A0A317MQF9_9GAMM|nr:hypothetical protein [Plasticicumulans acidivorans]PWV58864.1 hypothetical protein C7443_11345 [Plasticicumulans acidivorans]
MNGFFTVAAPYLLSYLLLSMGCSSLLVGVLLLRSLLQPARPTSGHDLLFGSALMVCGVSLLFVALRSW